MSGSLRAVRVNLLLQGGFFFRRSWYQRILNFLFSLPCFRSIPPIPPRTPPSICSIVPRKPLYIRTAHRNASEPLKMRRHLPDQKRRPAGGAPPAPSGPPGMGLPCSCCRAARLQSLPQARSASAGGRPPSNCTGDAHGRVELVELVRPCCTVAKRRTTCTICEIKKKMY